MAAVANDPLAIGRRLSLLSGTLGVVYDSGVELAIEGPAEYLVDRPNGGELRLGKATVWALGKGLAAADRGADFSPPTDRRTYVHPAEDLAGYGDAGKMPALQDAGKMPARQDAGRMPALQDAGPAPATQGAAELLAAAQQVQRYHRTRFSLSAPRVVVIERGGDFSLSAKMSGEVHADVIRGGIEFWYPRGVTSQDTVSGHFWGYAEADAVRGGFRAVCQVGEAPLAARVALANRQPHGGGIFVSAGGTTLLDQWRARNRAGGEDGRPNGGLP
jgi:hypothetical protein